MRVSKGVTLVLIGMMVALESSVRGVVAIAPPSFLVAQTSSVTQGLSPQQINLRAKQITVSIDGQNSGSGVILTQSGQNYTVLTNWHVVQSSGKYIVQTSDGREHNVEYRTVKQLPGADLALLEFSSNQNYQIAEVGDSNEVIEGQNIYFAGYPGQQREDPNRTYRFFSVNIVGILTTATNNGYSLIYSGEALPGMSGGPVLDQNGYLVGIHGNAQVNNVTGAISNYGIPIDTYKQLAQKIDKTLNPIVSDRTPLPLETESSQPKNPNNSTITNNTNPTTTETNSTITNNTKPIETETNPTPNNNTNPTTTETNPTANNNTKPIETETNPTPNNNTNPTTTETNSTITNNTKPIETETNPTPNNNTNPTTTETNPTANNNTNNSVSDSNSTPTFKPDNSANNSANTNDSGNQIPTFKPDNSANNSGNTSTETTENNQNSTNTGDVAANPDSVENSNSGSESNNNNTNDTNQKTPKLPPDAIIPGATVPRVQLISAATGIDYRPLRDLLSANKWQEADRETSNLLDAIVQSADRRSQGLFVDLKGVGDLSCQDLGIVDQLWLKYSNGRFGFSQQKQVWDSLGTNQNGSTDKWRTFATEVGWKKGDIASGSGYLLYEQLSFNPQQAPSGHLPWWFGYQDDYQSIIKYLFSHCDFDPTPKPVEEKKPNDNPKKKPEENSPKKADQTS